MCIRTKLLENYSIFFDIFFSIIIYSPFSSFLLQYQRYNDDSLLCSIFSVLRPDRMFFPDATCLSICKRIVKKKRREQKLETSAIWSLVFRIGKTVRPVSPFRPGFPSCLVPHPRLDTFLAYRCTRVGRERVGWRKVG